MVLQRQVREVGDALGPLHEREELLVSGVADVGDGVIRLTEQQHPRERAQEKGRIGQCKITDSHQQHIMQHQIKLAILKVNCK